MLKSPVNIIYSGALLRFLLHVRLIPTSHNRPGPCQLQTTTTEHFSTDLVQIGATEQYSACKFHSHKRQPHKGPSISEKRHWAFCTCKSNYHKHNRPGTYQLEWSSTTWLVPIICRIELLSTLLHVSLIPIRHKSSRTYELLWCSTDPFLHLSLTPLSVVTISYRDALLSTLLHVSIIPIRHKRRSANHFQWSATEQFSACLILTCYHQLKAYELQRNASEHSSTYKSQFHKPQWGPYMSVTEDLLKVSLISTSHNMPTTYQ
jgi:hypothetical protein